MSLNKKLNVPLGTHGVKSIGYKHFAFTIVLFALVVRFVFLTTRYLWCDEASSVLTGRYDVVALLYHSSFDVHPPLYYLLLHGWMELFGDSILAVRSLSVVFGVMAVALSMVFTRHLVNERAALAVGWLMAIMPIAVRYSQEARMYALMGLLTIAATMALVMWLHKPNNRYYLALYAVLTTLNLYTHYFAIFTVFTHWLILLALSCRPGAERYIREPAWWLANASIGLAYIPWLLVLLNLVVHIPELRVGGDVGWIPRVEWDDFPAMYWRFFTGHDGSNSPTILFWLLPAFFIGLCCQTLTRRGIARKFNLLLVGGMLIPVTLVFAISWHTPLFVDRYFYSVALGIPLVLGMLIAGMNNRGYGIFLLVFFSVIFGVGLRNDYPHEKDNFKLMVHNINNHYQSNDVVVVSNMFFYLSYVYYNKGNYLARLYTPDRPNGISGKPNAYGFGTFFHDSAEQTYIDDLSRLSSGYHRVWLVSGGDFNQDFGSLPKGWVNTATFKNGDFETRLFEVRSTPSSGEFIAKWGLHGTSKAVLSQ
ncbi:glycosyltransferase family 39 protein [Serratia liquefaciens]|uniref:glycosyltransferase family 39 protein n=1 Tax=Serratia liquefaciens TaxID=614 RepID=UPI003905DF14